jgi:L-ascorbate metabolism protein UlaG (beta-lactamase superfamily)
MALTRRGLLAASVALPAAALAMLTGRSALARYHDGPVSDHFDGTRFFDPHGAPPKSLLQLARWRLGPRGEPWPERLESPFRDSPPLRVDAQRWRISYVGHASFLLHSAGMNVLLDPVWSERVSPFSFYGPTRINAPGIPFDALPPIDLVLVSHAHYDHLDLPTLSRLAAVHRPRFIVPLGNDAIMRGADPPVVAEAHDWGDRLVHNDLAVTLAPMRHWSARGITDRNKALWAAFVLDAPAGRILHVGDSGYGDGWHFRNARERHGPFSLAILPIGAYEPRWFMRDQHMNPAEAVEAWRASGAEHALGHHYGTFRLSNEAVDAPPRALAQALADNGVAESRFRLLRPGQVWELASSAAT